MKINVVTIFPEVVESILGMGMLAVGARTGAVSYRVVTPREFTRDTHRTVDDEPYGGGAGMVMMAPPIVEAVEHIAPRAGSPVILMSPAGRPFKQATAQRLAGEDELTLICGRYKGVDERVRELVVTEEISIGDYVLSGGELAAGVVIESVVRLLDGVLGDRESGETDSFTPGRSGLLDCAWYTRPVAYRGLKVPDTLLSGHHAEIDKWRHQSSLDRTKTFRPDLFDGSGPESSKEARK